jgi:hypothetical protein
MEDNSSKNSSKEGVSKGDSFFRTANTNLAVAMLTVGFTPAKNNPIVRNVNKGGETVFYNLSTRSVDGKYESLQCHKAWKDGTKHIEENQDDPFAVAMATLMNLKEFNNLINKKARIFEYKLDNGPTVWVGEGTKKQKVLEAKYGNKRKI